MFFIYYFCTFYCLKLSVYRELNYVDVMCHVILSVLFPCTWVIKLQELTITAVPVLLNLGILISLTTCPSEPELNSPHWLFCYRRHLLNINNWQFDYWSTCYQASSKLILIASKINMGTTLHEKWIPISKGITTW